MGVSQIRVKKFWRRYRIEQNRVGIRIESHNIVVFGRENRRREWDLNPRPLSETGSPVNSSSRHTLQRSCALPS